MKRDEHFNRLVKSRKAPSGLKFRAAILDDCSAISRLLTERNPKMTQTQLFSKSVRDFERSQSDSIFKICVAELKKDIVGFCRFSHSSTLAEEKKKYPSPVGWYGMGMMVDLEFRRQSIARFMNSNRVEILKTMGINQLYSIVDSNNLASIKMHQEFGYVEVSRAQGFLHFGFDQRPGILFKLTF